jgi:hypothetical protein
MVISPHATRTQIGCKRGSPPRHGEGAGEEEDLLIPDRSRRSAAAVFYGIAESRRAPIRLEFAAQPFPFAAAYRAGRSFFDDEEDFDGVRGFLQSALWTFGAFVPESV